MRDGAQPERARHAAQHPRPQLRYRVLHLQHALVLPAVRIGERGVARERRGAVAPALEHGPQLAPAGDREVERRADALRGDREAVAGGVAGEEDPVLGGGAEPVRDPVALVAVGREAEVVGQPDRRLLDPVVGVEGADADAHLVARRERPAVARADEALVDPQLEVAARPARVHLQPAREPRVRRLHERGAEVALPAQRVDDERRADVAAVRVHDDLAVAAQRPPVDLGGLELRPAAPLRPQRGAQRRVVEGGERPAERPARARPRRVDEQRAERLPDRRLQAQVGQPLGRRRAGGGLPLADLVAVEDEHAGARPAQLAGDGQARERGSADDDVERAAEGCTLGTALGGSDGHRRAWIIGNGGPGTSGASG